MLNKFFTKFHFNIFNQYLKKDGGDGINNGLSEYDFKSGTFLI